jgi:site-specific recombinase XerD
MFHVELFADWLSRTNSERGRMRKLSALRTFFAYYFKKGEITKNVLPNIDLPKTHRKNIVRLDGEESGKIVEIAKSGQGLTPGQMRFHGKNGFRDTVILKFFLSSGMRVSELVGLNVGDIDLEGALFKITRKGGNETVLYLTKELVELLREYLMQDEKMPAADRPLFLGPDLKTRLGVRSVQNLVAKYARTAAPLKKISPHKLRSTFGTNLYHATGDIYAVADFLGHQNVNTTKKHYAEITEEIKQDAIRKFEDANKK